jgi:hypothetical protein
MELVANSIYRERMSAGIIVYRIEYASIDTMMRLSDDILHQIQINSDQAHQMILVDLTTPATSVPYLTLTNRDLFNVGITQSGRLRLEQYLKYQPETSIYVAVVLADDAAGQLAKSYASGAKNDQIIGKLFFDLDHAKEWLVSQRGYRGITGQLDTHRIDPDKVSEVYNQLIPENLKPKQNEIFLMIHGAVEVLFMEDRQRVIIGRTKPNSDWKVDIDMSSYGKIGQTVSRQHATLHMQDDVLYLTDLGSTNGTYINGKRIQANVPHAVNRSHRISLGKLDVSIVR